MLNGPETGKGWQNTMCDTLDYVRRHYGVDVHVGSKIKWRGRDGTVVRGTHYVWYVYDDDPKQREWPIHPREHGLVYTGERGPLPKVSRSRKRYRRYLEVAECFDSFRQFLQHESLGTGKE